MVFTFSVVPGKALGDFALGMNVRQFLACLEDKEDMISNVEILYSQNNPLGQSLVIRLLNEGCRFEFDPITQLLSQCIVTDSQSVRLTFRGTQFSGPPTVATLASIYELFGLTHPGRLDLATGLYRLTYRGVFFEFPIPPAFRSLYQGDQAEYPAQLPDGTTPVPHRIVLVPVDPLPAVQRSVARMGCSLSLPTLPEDPLRIGDSVQSVLSRLGAPQHVFQKALGPGSPHARTHAHPHPHQTHTHTETTTTQPQPAPNGTHPQTHQPQPQTQAQIQAQSDAVATTTTTTTSGNGHLPRPASPALSEDSVDMDLQDHDGDSSSEADSALLAPTQTHTQTHRGIQSPTRTHAHLALKETTLETKMS
eukprot:gnl/Trimastix_PCT/3552.p1 GENE.gnl/Trimastix_PCT/3552~~gnl/Trimastix_PCT/3552.p1  ORF type:complete len:364 (-),score=51.88 gnl/Trimastix_PCT/3552:414-1505(-)